MENKEIKTGGVDKILLQYLYMAAGDVDKSLAGPYVDLSTPEGNMTAYARLQGDLDSSKTKYGWYKGMVSAVMPPAAAAAPDLRNFLRDLVWSVILNSLLVGFVLALAL